MRNPMRPNMALAMIAFTVVFGVMLACARAIQSENPKYWSVSGAGDVPTSQGGVAKAAAPARTRVPGGPILTPTPDAPHPLPPVRIKAEEYTVQVGDTLGSLAKRYGVGLDLLVKENNLDNPNLLSVGQSLTIPVPTPEGTGPAFKIIPDSELVYGPASVGFNIDDFIQSKGGFLASYQEDVEGKTQRSAQIVQRVAQDYSVNPRLLLAVLEYQSGWLTKASPAKETQDYPLGVLDSRRKGLYRQLAWAANNLNRGFYMWRVNGVATWLLNDNSIVPINPTINAGTAGVQQFFASLYDQKGWDKAVSPGGFFTVYNNLFGYPFDLAVEPLQPENLAQPTLQLPFEAGDNWAFTGGPHGGWGDGSAWAALDFAPPGEALGCVQNDAFAVAVADGLIVRTGNGAVVQDLDGDGNEQTGWTILYMHIESRQRVQEGTYVKAGERIGHPSCEGGVSTGTHMHLVRRYNGEWIPADQKIPFVLDGWTSHGDGNEYNGYLVRDGVSIEAYAGRSAQNGIQR